MNKILLALTLTCFTITIAMAQRTLKVAQAIETLTNDVTLKHAVWSICVMSVDSNKVLIEHNDAISLIPASTLKIMTTGAALSILGDDYQFKTTIQYSGTFDPATGVIAGNVYIVGGGDPALGSKYFAEEDNDSTVTQKWARLLKELGVKKIEGAVIADARIFEGNVLPSNWIWGDMGNYFGAGPNGLSYRDNMYTIDYKSGAAGTTTTINKVEPNISDLNIVNRVIANGRSDNAYIYGAPYSNYRMVEGSIPANRSSFKVKGSMPDPALYCAQELSESLTQEGIIVDKKATTFKKAREEKYQRMPSRALLHTHTSPKLDTIVYWLNMKSVNLYAEHLLRYMAYYKTGKGTESKGLDIVTEFWDSVGVDVGGLRMTDGSGLSRANAITTKTQAQALVWMMKNGSAKSFQHSLPLAGRSGSLTNMCRGTSAENNLCAKSGYLTGDRGYAGYVTTRSGELLSFSILANNYECTPSQMKKKMEKVMIELANID